MQVSEQLELRIEIAWTIAEWSIDDDGSVTELRVDSILQRAASD